MNDSVKEERQAFSTRLKLALKNANISTRPSVLVREFNRRARGMEVTAHGARKWLVGEAYPSPGRLLTLAAWLNVQVSWLRFGTQDAGPHPTLQPGSASSEQMLLFQDIIALSGPAQAIVRELVSSLKKLESTA
jgi:hypothetical protein